jgi:hypothetical protein
MFTNGNGNPTLVSCRNIFAATINNVEYNLVQEPTVGVYVYTTNWIHVSTFILKEIFYVISVNNYYYFATTGSNANPYGIIKTTVASPSVIAYYIG